MSNHTPGPWGWNHARTRLNDPTGKPVLMDGEGIWDLCAPKLHKEERAHANAKLIAAAPDLLAALKSVLSMPDWDGTMLTSAARKQAKERARAAIAKAGG